MADPEFDPEKALAVLLRHGVKFVVIGGVAGTLHGSPLVSFDLDVAYERSRENIERLAAALKEVHARLRGVDVELPFVPDAKTLAAGHNFTFITDVGPVDFLGWTDGLNSYAELRERAIRMNMAGGTVLVASIDDLIAMKRAAGRGKDQAAILHLEEIRKLIAPEERGGAPGNPEHPG